MLSDRIPALAAQGTRNPLRSVSVDILGAHFVFGRSMCSGTTSIGPACGRGVNGRQFIVDDSR